MAHFFLADDFNLKTEVASPILTNETVEETPWYVFTQFLSHPWDPLIPPPVSVWKLWVSDLECYSCSIALMLTDLSQSAHVNYSVSEKS